MWQSMGLHRIGHGLATKQQKLTLDLPSVQFSSVAQSCLTLRNSMNRSMPPFKIILGFPGNLVGKESTCNTGDLGLIPGSGRPLEKEMATYSSTLPGKSHGLRSLVGYSPWGLKEPDVT